MDQNPAQASPPAPNEQSGQSGFAGSGNYFDVRVPMIGTTMLVQRVWIAAQGAGAQADVLRCGAALAENSFRIERAWRSFVDAIPARPSDSLRVQL